MLHFGKVVLKYLFFSGLNIFYILALFYLVLIHGGVEGRIHSKDKAGLLHRNYFPFDPKYVKYILVAISSLSITGLAKFKPIKDLSLRVITIVFIILLAFFVSLH